MPDKICPAIRAKKEVHISYDGITRTGSRVRNGTPLPLSRLDVGSPAHIYLYQASGVYYFFFDLSTKIFFSGLSQKIYCICQAVVT